MPAISLCAVGMTDPPPFPDVRPVIHDNTADWDMAVLNAGMASGEPSVILIAHTASGDIALETSLACLLAAATGLRAMAETQFGWVQV